MRFPPQAFAEWLTEGPMSVEAGAEGSLPECSPRTTLILVPLKEDTRMPPRRRAVFSLAGSKVGSPVRVCCMSG